MNKKRANLRDVARKAGVSVATVSRVMNSPKQVSPDTLSRVEAAMSELRFTPSAAARAINTGRTRTVAALLPTLDNSTFARFAEGLENRLGDFDLSLVVASTEEDPEVELAKARQLVNIGAEALVVSGVSQPEAFRAFVERTSLPAVGISLSDTSAWLPTIGYDNRGAALLAFDHLTGLGHRDIAVVHGPKATNDRTRARLDALHHAALPDGQSVSFRYVEVPFSVEGGWRAAEELLRLENRPTAILAMTDVLAMGVMSRLQAAGLSIPDDISVMGMEDLPGSAFTYPALTTVHLPVRRMGEHTAEALARWLDNSVMPSHEELPIALAQRASTGRPRRA